jgi:hypothetical protein
MRIAKDSKVQLTEGVKVYMNEFGMWQMFATHYKPEEEAQRLTDENEAIEAGFVKHEGYWMSKMDADMVKRCEEEMQEHKRIIIEG